MYLKDDVCGCVFRNSFSQLVGEEFLKFFDFSGDTLDAALRQFVHHLTATADPQDCDQLLLHFAQRYQSANSSQYKSPGNVSPPLSSNLFCFIHLLSEYGHFIWVYIITGCCLRTCIRQYLNILIG